MTYKLLFPFLSLHVGPYIKTFVSSLPYLTEVSSLVRGWLRVHAIFSYLPLLSLVGNISFRWYLLCQLSRYLLGGHGIFCLLYFLLLVVFVMCLCFIICPRYCRFLVLNCFTISLPVHILEASLLMLLDELWMCIGSLTHVRSLPACRQWEVGVVRALRASTFISFIKGVS